MERKKISMFIVIFFIIVFVIWMGLLVWNNKKRENTLSIQEYTPQEEITYEQLRTTNIVLYYLNKESGELGTEIKQIDSRELLEKPEIKLIKLLIAGPKSGELTKLIPENTKILDSKLEKGVLTINFSEEFILEQEEDKIKLIIESINKTIFQLNEINSIKILVAGEEKTNK